MVTRPAAEHVAERVAAHSGAARLRSAPLVAAPLLLPRVSAAGILDRNELQLRKKLQPMRGHTSFRAPSVSVKSLYKMTV